MNGKQLKNSILQWAIQGKLVPQDPNDEPASVLLERIREEKARLIKEKKIKKDKNESIIFRGDDNSHYEKFADGKVKCIDDEIPFEIPQSWCWVRFGSLVIHNPQVTADDETNAAFMPMTLIDAGYGSSYTYETKKWETIKTGFTKIAIGDIAYAKITPCFQNRKSFILGEVPGRVAAATTELNVIRTYANTLDEWYILYFLKSEYFIKEARYKGTAGQQRVLTDYVQNKLVPLPPLNEQKRIVQKIKDTLPIIRTYGKSQEALDKLNAEIFDKLKKSVLQEAIQGKLVPQDPNDEPALVLLERIKEEKAKLVKEGKLKKKDLVDSVIFKDDDNKYYEQIGNEVVCIDDELPFEIPNLWQWCRLSNIANLYTGNSINETEKKARYTDVVGTEYIATKDVGFDNTIDYKNGIAIPDKYINDFRIAPNNSVLMCIEGGSAGRKIGILSQDVCFGNKLCCFSTYADISEYIFYYLQSPLFFDIFNSNKNGIIGGVSVNNLKQLFIPLPPYNEIKRIVTTIKNILKGIEEI